MRAGICTPKWKGFIFICDVDWMRKAHVRGVVIGSYILFSNIPDQHLFRHELEHAYQQIRDGRVRFYLKYFYYQVVFGYQKNPYEVEARECSRQPLTSIEEAILCSLNEGSPK